MGRHIIHINESKLAGIVRDVLAEWGGVGINPADKRLKDKSPKPIRMSNGLIVLMHQSSHRITDGVIDGIGKPKNVYSNNSDFPNYFWGSEITGIDPSNGGNFEYYCLVEPEKVYDYTKNTKGYSTLKEAARNEQFVMARWFDGAVVVVTNHPTKIDYIKANTTIPISGVYDRKWRLLRTPMISKNGRGGGAVDRSLLADMRPGRDVPVPDFLDQGYSYYQLKELAGKK